MASAEVLFAGFQNKDKIVQQIGKLPLSPDTCARRYDELSGDIFMQLMTKLRAFPAFSLALDERCIRRLPVPDPNEVHNDNAGRLQCAIEVRRRKLFDVGTFGFSVYRRAPSMFCRQAGFVALFRQEIGKPNLITYHCIIHQQAFFAKARCGLQDRMKTVVERVNLNHARSLNHRRFQNHLMIENSVMCYSTTVSAG